MRTPRWRGRGRCDRIGGAIPHAADISAPRSSDRLASSRGPGRRAGVEADLGGAVADGTGEVEERSSANPSRDRSKSLDPVRHVVAVAVGDQAIGSPASRRRFSCDLPRRRSGRRDRVDDRHDLPVADGELGIALGAVLAMRADREGVSSTSRPSTVSKRPLSWLGRGRRSARSAPRPGGRTGDSRRSTCPVQRTATAYPTRAWGYPRAGTRWRRRPG